MNIIKEIELCAAEYEMSTGLKPRRVYLGKQEFNKLAQWASDNGYFNTTADVPTECNEVAGMRVFKVYDDFPHMRCCV